MIFALQEVEGAVTVAPSVYVPVIVALLALTGTMVTVFAAKQSKVEQRLERLEKRDKLSWLYIRTLITHASTHAPGVPLPEPPDGWME